MFSGKKNCPKLLNPTSNEMLQKFFSTLEIMLSSQEVI